MNSFYDFFTFSYKLKRALICLKKCPILLEAYDKAAFLKMTVSILMGGAAIYKALLLPGYLLLTALENTAIITPAWNFSMLF